MINVSKSRDQEVRPVFVKVVEITFKEAADWYIRKWSAYIVFYDQYNSQDEKTLKWFEES